MSDPGHHLRPVFWQNDMLVDEAHLRHEQRYFEDLAGWGLVRCCGIYGIAAMANRRPGLKLQAQRGSGGDETLFVEVLECLAVSPDGRRISHSADDVTAIPLRAERALDSPLGLYDVFLSIDEGRGPELAGHAGDVPLATAALALRVEPHRDRTFERPGEVKIGQVSAQIGGEIALDSDYIPPCLGLCAHGVLKTTAQRVVELFEEIMKRTLEVGLFDWGQRLRDSRLTEDDANIFRFMCERLSIWLGSNVDRLRLAVALDRPPHELFLVCKEFFRLLDLILGSREARGRTSLYAIWSIWDSRFSEKQFGQELSALLVQEYDHAALSVFLRRAVALLEQYSDVLGYMIRRMNEDPERRKTIVVSYPVVQAVAHAVNHTPFRQESEVKPTPSDRGGARTIKTVTPGGTRYAKRTGKR